MKKEKKEIPKFKNEKEEALFWENNSTMDFDLIHTPDVDIKITQDAQEKIRGRLKPVTLRLKQSQIDDAKEIAELKGIPYQTLIRVWVSEAIRREKKPEPTNIVNEKTSNFKEDVTLKDEDIESSDKKMDKEIGVNWLNNISSYMLLKNKDDSDILGYFDNYLGSIVQNPIETSNLPFSKILEPDCWDNENKSCGGLRLIENKAVSKKCTSNAQKTKRKSRARNIHREDKKIG